MKDWAQKLEQWDVFNGEDVTVDYSVTFSDNTKLSNPKVNERTLAQFEDYDTFAREALEQAGVGLGYLFQTSWDASTVDGWLKDVDEAMTLAQNKVIEWAGDNALTSLINGAMGDINKAMQGDFSSTTSSKSASGSFLKNGITYPRRQMVSNVSGFASGDAKGKDKDGNTLASAAATDGNLPYGEVTIPAWRLKDFNDIESGISEAIEKKLIPAAEETSKETTSEEKKVAKGEVDKKKITRETLKSYPVMAEEWWSKSNTVGRPVDLEQRFYNIYENDESSLLNKNGLPEEVVRPDEKIVQKYTSDNETHIPKTDTENYVGSIPSTSSYSGSEFGSVYQDRMSYMLKHYLSNAKFNNISLSSIKDVANAMMETTHPLDGCNWILMVKESSGDFRVINFRFKTMVIPDNTRGSSDTYYGDQVVTIPINNTTYEPVFKSNFLVDRKLESLKNLMDSFGYRKDLTNKDANIEAIYDLNALNSWKPIKYDTAVLLIVPGWFYHDAFKVSTKDEKHSIERLDTLWNNTSSNHMKNNTNASKFVDPENTNTYPAYVFRGFTIQSFKMDLNFDSSKKEGWEVELTMSYKDVDAIPQSKPDMRAFCKIADGIYNETNGSAINIATQV